MAQLTSAVIVYVHSKACVADDGLMSINFENLYERWWPLYLLICKPTWKSTTDILWIMKVNKKDGVQIFYTSGRQHRRRLPPDVHIWTSSRRTTTLFCTPCERCVVDTCFDMFFAAEFCDSTDEKARQCSLSETY